MIKKIIMKSNININGMIRHGSIAVFTMFTIGYLFGLQNMMLAFPIALTSIALSKQNLHIKTFRKTVRLIFVYCLIVTLSLIGTINPIIGVPINFLSIFLIGYFLTVGYNPTMYKPFLMLYVFTNFIEFSNKSLLEAMLSIIFGVVVVILSEVIIIKTNNKTLLNKTIAKSLNILIEQINFMVTGNFDYDLYNNHSKEMRSLCYQVYITRYRSNLTTNLGKVKYDLYVLLEKLNIVLEKIYIEKNNAEYINRSFFVDVKGHLSLLKGYAEESVSFEELQGSFNGLKMMYKENIKEERYINEILEILNYVDISATELHNMDKEKMNKVYKEWERSDIERVRDLVKSNYKKGSIRINFALRLAIVLTASLYIGHVLGYYKIIWVSITVMSVIQPYYEDTLKRIKERLRGNLIGIVFVITILSITDNKIITVSILIASLYLTFAFKEYYKLSLFTTLASMSVASLYAPTTSNAIFRVFYVAIGLLVIVCANRFLFPYKLQTGMKDLIRKLLIYDKILLEEKKIAVLEKRTGININRSSRKGYYRRVFERKTISKFKKYSNRNKVNEKAGNSKRIRDLIILSTLTAEKLYIRNLQVKDSGIDLVINDNNIFIIEVAYNMLKYDYIV